MSRTFQCRAVPNTWLEHNGRRLDCGPYMSGAIEAKELLKRHTTDILANVTEDIFNSGREGRIWVNSPEYGVPFMGSTDILAADLSYLPLISKKQIASNPKFTIGKGWTLITRSGRVGRMAYARPDMDGVACSEHVMRVVPKEDVIKPGYLYAYLSSRFGVPIVVSGTYGAIIQHIEPHHIANLPVPRLGIVEEQAHELVQQAAINLSKHQLLMDEATLHVFESCGLTDQSRHAWLCDSSDKGFCINSKNMNGIFRAWNHSRRANRIKIRISDTHHNPLGELIDLDWLRWRLMFKRIFADPKFGIELITQKPLFNLVPEGKWIRREYLLNHSPKYVVPDETILIAKQGTLGEHELYCRCEYITGNRALTKAYSDHCMRIVVKNNSIHPGYLFAFLRSEAAFRLLRSLSEGAKQQDLHWRTVPLLPVPRNSPEIEKEIGDKIRTAFLLRNNAVDMFEQARTLVERAIEEGSR